MNISIVHPMPYPEGFAATVRIQSYSKGLTEAGCRVNVLCLKPRETKGSERNHSVRGVHDGISYEYTSGTIIRERNILLRIYHNTRGLIVALRRFWSMRRKEEAGVVLIVGPIGFIKELLFFLSCKICRLSYLQERTEYPFLSSTNSILFRINLFLYLHLGCKFFDGMLVISDTLANYFSKYLRASVPVFIMPILVDHKRFDISIPPAEREYIAYCGSMEGNKDGLLDLLKAFSLVAPRRPGLFLYLIGRTDFPGYHSLQEEAKNLAVDKQVFFTGRVSNEQMAILLKGAKVLLLARPDNLQAQANFPTKIGEYLATGNPVLATRVGVITTFLEDGENIFLAAASDPEDFAKRMEYILNHEEHARRVGAEGRKLAVEVFDYAYQGRKLADFMRGVTKGKKQKK